MTKESKKILSGRLPLVAFMLMQLQGCIDLQCLRRHDWLAPALTLSLMIL